jgi:hypothetical protein
MPDRNNDALAKDLRAYLSHVTAEPMPSGLQDRAVEAPFARQERRRAWSGRLGASLLVGAVAVAAAAALVVHLQRSSVTVPGPAAPTTKTSPAPTPPPATAPPAPAVDVAAAQQSALALFVRIPKVLNDPQAGYVWSGGPASATHMSAPVKARLALLGTQGYFSDAGKCGEDYISHTQNGLYTAPAVVSTVTAAEGSVTVVIHREGLGSTVLPDLTAVMTDVNGTWLATDLASGMGPDASIFSATPNC